MFSLTNTQTEIDTETLSKTLLHIILIIRPDFYTLMIRIYVALIASFLLMLSCSSPQNPLPFDFEHPDIILKLPASLHEISGISFYKKSELACVQDEKGIIYFYNLKKDKLRNATSFYKDEDFEGIANVNDTLFVLSSKGIIFEVDSINEKGYSNSYQTFLSRENNCEGLCFDKNRNSLLIACKGKPKKGTAPKGTKAIYSFDLLYRKLSETPAYIIDPDSVQKHIASSETNFFNRLFNKSSNKEIFQFEPSELCIDPFTNDIFILSSVGKTILSMNYNGKINFAFHLNPHLFKQPEGLTFSKDGSMYISDEGKDGKANLIKINRVERVAN
jgi:uncharacterized protein YjiK